MNTRSMVGAALAALCAVPVASAGSFGSGFTYQGHLIDGGSPAAGVYDFTFRLYSSPGAFIAIGSPIVVEDVPVTDGVFSTEISFPLSSYDGDERWLSVSVRPGASTGSFTVLSPRQELTPTPHALVSEKVALPLYETGESSDGLIPGALFGIGQSGSSSAIMGATTGPGDGLFGWSLDDGPAIFARGDEDGPAIKAIAEKSHAGLFQINNPANGNAVVHAVTEGSGSALSGQSLGTGAAVRGINSGTGNSAKFVSPNVFSAADGVVIEHEAQGAALSIESTGAGAAINIRDGAIRVEGAGIGTQGPVFVHKATSGNISGIETTIDHPMCNGHPDAILIVTPRLTYPGQSNMSAVSPVGVDYYNGKWRIYKLDLEDMYADTKFNVMVVLP